MPGGMEWLLILLVALLIFGKNLPQVMRELGRSFASFRDSMGMGEQIGNDLNNPFRWDQEDADRLHPPLARPDPHSGSEIPPLRGDDLKPAQGPIASASEDQSASPHEATGNKSPSDPHVPLSNESPSDPLPGVPNHDRP